MKKLLSLLLVLLMSLSMMAVLSSCDDLLAGIIPSDEEEAGEDNKNDEQTGDKNDNTQQTPTVITTITEAEWNAYDDILNYTVTVSSSLIKGDGDGALSTVKNDLTLKLTEESAMQLSNGKLMYMVLEDGVWYELELDEDEEIYYKDESGGFGGSLLDFLNSMCRGYSDLTYDEVKKAYVGNSPINMMGVPANYSIYFEDGKPTKAEFSGKQRINEDGYTYQEVKFEVTISDINKTEIQLPEYEERARATLTEEEWAAFGEQDNFTVNMAYVISVGSMNMEMSGWIKYTADAKVEYDPIEETETMYVLIDGEVYELYLDEDGNYLATPYREDADDLSTSFSEDFSLFTYDEDERAYSYSYTDESGNNTVIVRAEDGVVVEMILIMESSAGDVASLATVTMTFENVGTTVIDVPTYAIVEEAEVSEELWNSLREIYNYTLTVSGEYAEFDSNGNEMTQDLSALEMQNEELKYKGDLDGNGLVWVLVEGAWYEAYSDDPDNFVESTDPLVSMGDMLVFDGEYISFESLVYNSDTDGYDLDYTVNLWGVDCEASFYFIDGIPYMVEFFGISTEMDGDVEVTRAVDMTYLFTDIGSTTFE